MKQEVIILCLLLILSPILGELVSGNTSPGIFFNPIVLLSFICLYGLGTLIVRELRVKWNLDWSVVFLAIGFGFIQSILFIINSLGESFSLNPLIIFKTGLLLKLIFFNSIICVLIPILLVDYLWPEFRNKSLLKKNWIFGVFLIFLANLIFRLYSIVKMEFFYLYLFLISLLVISLLFKLSYSFRRKRISKDKPSLLSPIVFGILGFLSQGVNNFLPNILSEYPDRYILMDRASQIGKIYSEYLIYSQILFFALVFLFMIYQIYHMGVTKKHITNLVFGSVLFWIILLCLNGFDNLTSGKLIIGVFSFVLLLFWRDSVLKNKEF